MTLASVSWRRAPPIVNLPGLNLQFPPLVPGRLRASRLPRLSDQPGQVDDDDAVLLVGPGRLMPCRPQEVRGMPCDARQHHGRAARVIGVAGLAACCRTPPSVLVCVRCSASGVATSQWKASGGRWWWPTCTVPTPKRGRRGRRHRPWLIFFLRASSSFKPSVARLHVSSARGPDLTCAAAQFGRHRQHHRDNRSRSGHAATHIRHHWRSRIEPVIRINPMHASQGHAHPWMDAALVGQGASVKGTRRVVLPPGPPTMKRSR